MFCKYINEHRIEPAAKNGFIDVDGKRVGISNLPKYLEEHKDIAEANGYYELIEGAIPEYDAKKQWIEAKYVLEDNKIRQSYEVYEMPEEVIVDEVSEDTTAEN